MTDVNDFTDYSEACACGHTRRQHGNLPGCSGTRDRIDVSALPAPEYAPGEEDHPFPWPVNWPSPEKAPTAVEPCTCRSFGLADPEPDLWPEGDL